MERRQTEGGQPEAYQTEACQTEACQTEAQREPRDVVEPPHGLDALERAGAPETSAVAAATIRSLCLAIAEAERDAHAERDEHHERDAHDEWAAAIHSSIDSSERGVAAHRVDAASQIAAHCVHAASQVAVRCADAASQMAARKAEKASQTRQRADEAAAGAVAGAAAVEARARVALVVATTAGGRGHAAGRAGVENMGTAAI